MSAAVVYTCITHSCVVCVCAKCQDVTAAQHQAATTPTSEHTFCVVVGSAKIMHRHTPTHSNANICRAQRACCHFGDDCAGSSSSLGWLYMGYGYVGVFNTHADDYCYYYQNDSPRIKYTRHTLAKRTQHIIGCCGGCAAAACCCCEVGGWWLLYNIGVARRCCVAAPGCACCMKLRCNREHV